MKEKMIDAVVKMMHPSPLISLDTRLHILNRTLQELNIKARGVQVNGLDINPYALPLWYWEADTMDEILIAKAFRKRLCANHSSVDTDADRHNINETLKAFQRSEEN